MMFFISINTPTFTTIISILFLNTSFNISISTSQGGQGGEVVVAGPIQLTQRRAQGPAQALHHALDARDVVVGSADERKQTLSWVLAQHSNTYRKKEIHFKYTYTHDSPHIKCVYGVIHSSKTVTTGTHLRRCWLYA